MFATINKQPNQKAPTENSQTRQKSWSGLESALKCLVPAQWRSEGHLLFIRQHCSCAAVDLRYLRPSISCCLEHTAPLPEINPPRLQEVLQEVLAREQRKSWCEVEGKGQEETAGNDNVCQAISPLYPGGVQRALFNYY